MIRLTTDISPDQRSWRNDPSILSGTRQNELLTQEDQEKWLRRIKKDASVKMFGIELLPEKIKLAGKFFKQPPVNIGTCGLTSISLIHRTAEYSLLIAPSYQGKGYASEALKLLLKYGFHNLNLETIYGDFFQTNVKSIHIAEKLGFVMEGILRNRYEKNGRRLHSIMMSLTRKEYDALHFANQSTEHSTLDLPIESEEKKSNNRGGVDEGSLQK